MLNTVSEATEVTPTQEKAPANTEHTDAWNAS
jgi:hypothetical protein